MTHFGHLKPKSEHPVRPSFKTEWLLYVQVLAEAIVNAAQERFSGMAAEQIAHNPVGVMKAGLSHLSKREERETGSVHKGGLASLAQVRGERDALASSCRFFALQQHRRNVKQLQFSNCMCREPTTVPSVVSGRKSKIKWSA